KKERKYEKEKPVYRKTPIGTSDKSTDDEEFFNKRYNEKKIKYDKIKKLMGDEIDEELNNARKRLHKDISLRIKYFEEKEMLTLREAQELEDLKRPGKLDEEELFVEEYVINEIYEGLTEKEKEDKDRAENIEEENIFEEKIPEENFERDDEKVINTAEILSSSTESSSESDKESEIIEIVEIPNFDFTIIYTEDLTFENLFGENFEEDFEIFEMALNIAKCKKYDGSENPEDWIKEFERVARENAWVDADHADNSLSYNFAIAHLEGEAADWF